MTEQNDQWGQKYVTGVPYVSEYHDDLNPTVLNYVCAINGHPPVALAEGFTYCELGCGHGLTTNVLAAANPAGQFWGVDFNPRHIASATEAAGLCRLPNVTFLQEDFGNLTKHELPDFDFICLHGVYSWVNAELRELIGSFIAQRLKPGGIVELSYNAMPGWAAFLPLRQMMLAYTAHMHGLDPIERVRRGVGYLRYLCDHNGCYFAENPSARKVLEKIEESDARYVAHEFFNEDWHPAYFHEVTAQLGKVGLFFTGRLPVPYNYTQFCLPPDVLELLKTAPDRNTFEIHRDFFTNERFRRDVFTRPPERPVEPDADWFLDMSFIRSDSEQRPPLETRMPAGKITLKGREHLALFDMLESRACNFRQLCQSTELSEFSTDQLVTAIKALVTLGYCIPCARPSGPISPREPTTGISIAGTFNQVVLDACVFTAAPITLASLVSGGGICLSESDGVLLWAACEEGFERAAARVVQESNNRNLPIVNAEDETLEDPDEQLQRIEERLQEFRKILLPQLVAVGVVDFDTV